MPTLILHGDDDQIVPIGARPCIHRSWSRGHPEGLSRWPARPRATTHQDQFNADLLAFIQG